MDIFIGDKKQFGIEIKSAHLFNNRNPYGYAKIWLGGNFFGSIYDSVYLDGYLLGGLFQISNVPFLSITESFTDCHSMFEYFYKRLLDENDAEVHRYLINFGTFTDAFTIFAFKNNADVTVLWKIRDDNNYSNYSRFEDLINYPLNSFCYTVSYEKFRNIIESTEKFVLSI